MDQIFLAVFSNFFIDNEERFQRMKDSFYSFKDYNPNEWFINIRGKLKNEAGEFLKKELGDTLNLFYLQNRRGWFHDSKILAKNIKSDFIFFWIEDHILISSIEDFKNCIIEMKKFQADQLLYSFLTKEVRARFDIITPDNKGDFITTIRLDKKNCNKIRKKLNRDFYYTSCASIMTNSFFRTVLESKKPFLKRWPRHLPFDFEKKSKDNVKSIIIHSLPNRELFASIDDDRGENGYSLISRGLYENRISRKVLQMKEYEFMKRDDYLKNFFCKFLFLRLVVRFFKRFLYTINLFFN